MRHPDLPCAEGASAFGKLDAGAVSSSARFGQGDSVTLNLQTGRLMPMVMLVSTSVQVVFGVGRD